jgi:hypothetical protein
MSGPGTNYKTIFYKVDNFLFAQADKLKSSFLVQRINESINALPDSQQRMANIILALSMFVLPFILVGFLSISNWQNKSELDQKKVLIDNYSEYLTKQSELNDYGQEVWSLNTFNDQPQFQNRLKLLLQSAGIDPSKVSLSQFDVIAQTGHFIQIEATLLINRIANSELNKLLTGLMQADRAKISYVRLEKDLDKDLLQGEIRFNHYGKTIQGQSSE